MNSVWIIGAGQFGKIAVERLRLKYPDVALTVVDNDRVKLRPLERAATTIVDDGVAYLVRHLANRATPEWIVAAVPVHLAFNWVRLKLAAAYQIDKFSLPREIAERLPHVLEGRDGTLFTSHADFLCPDDCPETAGRCRVTGLPRPFSMYRELERISSGLLTPVIIRSRQLLPGVGGYRPGDLFDALEKSKKSSRPVLIGTACRCHGVLDAFNLRPRKT